MAEVRGLIMKEETKDYRIKSEDELSKKLYKIRKLNEELEKVNARRQKELDETEAWYRPEAKRISKEINEAENLIEDYTRRQLADNPYWKYADRNGKISKRKSDKWVYDKQAILDRGVSDKYIKTTKELDWKAYKKSLTELPDGRLVDENGEIISDIAVTHDVTITIKPTED